MVISVEIKNLDRIEQLIRAMPKEAEKELRKAVNKAEDAAHREALIQITRVYTVKMEAIAKELIGIKASGSSLQAILKSRGRPRGAGNFNVYPKNVNPNPGWTSRSGYSAEIITGKTSQLSSNYFWLSGKNNNVHLFKRADSSKRGKDFEIFATVSTPQMLENENVIDRVAEVTLAQLEAVFMKGMERRLSMEG
ncbi:MAG: hypothetical protein PHD08_08575 [Synergistaceae bacterium]|nr:hypothetical protein [Synergistaceae bacterium]